MSDDTAARDDDYWMRRGDEMRNEARRRFGYKWPDIVARWLGKCLRDEAKDANRSEPVIWTIVWSDDQVKCALRRYLQHKGNLHDAMRAALEAANGELNHDR